ncbi:uncharacterized protein [Nicotiana tomentosiformis]|uniref:uncharacterized protein n=1 Tax=Nicotiana tomentosiformis TaxID=4098 RepID=UPI00388C47FC
MGRKPGLGKDVVMRPPSGGEEVPVLNQVKERKRKDVSGSPSLEKKKPAKRPRKPKGGSGVMSSEAVLHSRDEPDEGEENLAYVRANVVIQQSSNLVETNQGTLAIIPEQEEAEIVPSQAKMVGRDTDGESSQAVEDILRDEFRIVDIGGSSQISDAMIREAVMLEDRSYEGIQESADIHGFLEGLESGASEEVTSFGGISASVLHHEAFLRIREEHDAEVRSLTEKSDSYKLLSEKLRADWTSFLVKNFEITINDLILQVRQRIEQIGQLNSQVDALLAEAEEFKRCMDNRASKKEAVEAQLELSDAQLRSAKENALGLIEKMKELQHRLDLATLDKADLAKELEVARSEVIKANKRADAKVAQFRIDVEVNQAKSASMFEHAKWQARREALEEVRAQGFDVGAEIELARAEENEARRLAFPEEDSDDSGESEDEDDAENTTSDED